MAPLDAIGRRDLLRGVGAGITAALLPSGWASLGPHDEAQALLDRAETLDRRRISTDAEHVMWLGQHQRLVKSAEDLVNRFPALAVTWHVLARCRWVDVDAELVQPAAVRDIERALLRDPSHIPSLILGVEIAGLTGLVNQDAPLLQKESEWQDRVGRIGGART